MDLDGSVAMGILRKGHAAEEGCGFGPNSGIITFPSGDVYCMDI